MKCFGMWHGGLNYALPDRHEKNDVIAFDSIEALKDELERREGGGDSYYPCVESSQMSVFFTNPFQFDDLEPDRIYSINRNGNAVQIY